jgi:hypothetical protein
VLSMDAVALSADAGANIKARYWSV